MGILIKLFLIVSVGSGISAGAEQSLPGDLLYQVKVNVNEQVRSSLAFSTEARAQWELKRAERRLEELEKLQARNRADGKTAAEIKARLAVHIKEALSLGVKLEAEGDTEASSRLYGNLETSLSAHAKAVESFHAEGRGNSEIAGIIALLHEEQESVLKAKTEVASRIVAEGQVELKAAAQGKMNAAENKIREVEQFLAGAEIKAEANAKAEARLQAAKDLFAEGQADIEATLYQEAFLKFQDCIVIAQEAKRLSETQADSEADINLAL